MMNKICRSLVSRRLCLESASVSSTKMVTLCTLPFAPRIKFLTPMSPGSAVIPNFRYRYGIDARIVRY